MHHLLFIPSNSLIIIQLFCLCHVQSYRTGMDNLLETSKQGPSFIRLVNSESEMNAWKSRTLVEFYNTRGAFLGCSASGHPRPEVYWEQKNGHFTNRNSSSSSSESSFRRNFLSGFSKVEDIENIRYTREDGTLVLLAFTSNQFRSDVHSTTYRCVATNIIGTIVSPQFEVRAVIKEDYNIKNSNEESNIDASTILKCIIPSIATGHLSVLHWQRNDGLIFDQSIDENSLNIVEAPRMLSDGSLLIPRVNKTTSSWKYRCRVKDRLSSEIRTSSTWSLILLNDEGHQQRFSFAPKIFSEFKDHIVSSGKSIQIGCVATASPQASYYWFKENFDTSLKPSSSLSLSSLVSETSFLSLAHLSNKDSGFYICMANNSFGEDRKRFKLIVKESLSVSMKPEKVMTKERESVTLECLVTIGEGNYDMTMTGMDRRNDKAVHSSSHLLIEWLKDGMPLQLNSRTQQLSSNKLRIESVVRSDKGMYECLVKDLLNSDEDNSHIAYTQLHIQEKAPQFHYTFHSHVSQPATLLSLFCSAFGSPPPKIQWFFFDKLISNEASSSSSSSSSSLNAERATITTLDHRIRIFDSLDRERNLVTSYLNVSSVSTRDGGLYKCKAINEIGSIEHSEGIRILGPPFVHRMENVSVTKGDRVSFTCPASGHPLDSIDWRKERKDLQHSRRFKSYKNGTLSIIDAHLDDEGWYECRAKSSAGNQIASGTIFVDILEKPAINPFMFAPDIREGMRATVICSLLSGQLPLSIAWFKNGKDLRQVHPEAETQTLGDFTSSLSISNVQRRHSGNYTCKAVVSTKVWSSFTASMKVQAFPKWIIKPEPQISAPKGSTVLIDCQAEGFPIPVSNWKLGHPLHRDNRESKVLNGEETTFTDRESNYVEYSTIVSGPHVHVLENGSLTIVSVSKEDEGDYVCETSNGLGSILTVTLKLKVNSPPLLQPTLEAVKVQDGQSAMLSCEALGDMPIVFTWVRNQKPLRLDTFGQAARNMVLNERVTKYGLISRLYLESVRKEDSSRFTCVALNDHGVDRKTLHLLVQGPPDSPKFVQVKEVKSRSIVLLWNREYDQENKALSYTVEYCKENWNWISGSETVIFAGNQVSVTLNDLLPNTSYKVRIIAENNFGKSAPSPQLTIKTDEEAPTLIPTQVKVNVLDSRSVKVKWDTSGSRVGSESSIDGYSIGYREVDGLSAASLSQPSTSSFLYRNLDFHDMDCPPSSTSLEHYCQYVLKALKRNTKYGLVVRAFNKVGVGPTSKEIFVQTPQNDPPSKVSAMIIGSTTHSLTIGWNGTDEENPITGYIVHYGVNSENWEEMKISGFRNSLELSNLLCGTKYQITISPFNGVGIAPPSDVLSESTVGDVPTAPTLDSLLFVNSTFAIVRLNSWRSNSCPIHSFIIQYKEHFNLHWIMLSNNIIPEQGSIVIPDLVPATFYDLLMTANSEAGLTEAQYTFSTLTPTGGTIAPLTQSGDSWLNISDPVIFAPLVCMTLVLLILFVTMKYLTIFRQHRSTINHQAVYGSNEAKKGDLLSMSSFNSRNSMGKKIVESPEMNPGYTSYYASYSMGNKMRYLPDSPGTDEYGGQACKRLRMSTNEEYDVPLAQEIGVDEVGPPLPYFK